VRVREAIADLQAEVSTTSTPRRRYSSGEALRAIPARFDNTTYDALQAASAACNVSINSLVNEAVQQYLVSPTYDARLAAAAQSGQQQSEAARVAQEKADEAIRKLSGG